MPVENDFGVFSDKYTKLTKLYVAYKYCKENDKSLEFMIQYIQDFSGCSFDEAMTFIKEKIKWQ